MVQPIEHVTFRPGELAEQLARGPLSPGGIAKRDLIRYYTMVNTAFDQWAVGWTMTGEAWDVIVDFAATRGWEIIPYPETITAQFKQFLTSPLGQRHDRVSRSMAAAALMNADYPELVGIIHAAETGLTHPRFRRSPQGSAATAGATLAGSSGPQ